MNTSVKTILKTFVAALVLYAAASCDLDETSHIPLVELGTPLADNVCLIEAAGGDYDLQVLSNGQYHIEMVSQAPWLMLGATEGNGDGIVKLTATENKEFKRMVSFVLCSDVDSRRDTVYVKQKGAIEAELSMQNTTVRLPGAGGSVTKVLSTNIPSSYFVIDVDYSDPDDAGWMGDITLQNTGDASADIVFPVESNANELSVRTAELNLSFVDGWGDKVSLDLILMQENANGSLGVKRSFAEIRGEYPNGGEVTTDIILEGIVVSNTEGGNAGENEQTNSAAIDYTISQKTVYIQSLDGSLGFALLTSTENDNTFKQFDKVQLLLKGAEIYLYDSPAKYYQIEGVKKFMIASQEKGTIADVVRKEKFYNELTDDDIYTYVTLKDVEFPIRKGSICPINEGYSVGDGSDRFAKYPLLVRDINGDSFYMYTNTVCVYRNDGTMVPQGSGKLSGVIVHERCSRFEWKNGKDLLDMEDDPELGYIGRYQIRHQTKEDIYRDMNMDFKDNFSELLAEYRYWNPGTETLNTEEGEVQNAVLKPTYGENGWFTHTYQTKYTGLSSKDRTEKDHYNQHMVPEVCFSYLGPIGTSKSPLFYTKEGMVNYGNTVTGNQNGMGIVLDPSKDRVNPNMEEWVGEFRGTQQWLAPGTSPDGSDASNTLRVANGGGNAGKGWCSDNCYCAFKSTNWWDFELDRGYAWMINFSTAGITKELSLQISVLNSSQKFYSPRYWKVEWSEVDSMKPEDDDKWNHVADYTVSDISQYANTLYSSMPGYKAIDIRLPAELLGKQNVYLRLMPRDKACSSGADYTDAFLTSEINGDMHASSIDYIGIRYNK